MKKLLAMLLSLVMVFALVSVASAEDADFTLVIKGGEVCANQETLAVDLTINGTVEDTLLTLTFDLTFDPELITYGDIEVDEAFNSFAINDTKPGEIRISLTSEGVQVGEGTPVAMLVFSPAEGLEPGTEIAFEVGEEAYAETQIDDPDRPNHVIVTQHDLAADFSPYVVSEAKAFNGVVKFNDGAVQYKGKTPYVMYDAAAGKHEPAFTVYEADGETEAATWKTFVTAGKFDSAKFKEENPELYAKYVGDSKETRRLVIKTIGAAKKKTGMAA